MMKYIQKVANFINGLSGACKRECWKEGQRLAGSQNTARAWVNYHPVEIKKQTTAHLQYIRRNAR